MADLTIEDLDALDALYAKATQGKWECATQWKRCALDHMHRNPSACKYTLDQPDPSEHQIIVPLPVGTDADEPNVVAGMWDYEDGGIRLAEDAQSIAALHNAWPSVSAMLRRSLPAAVPGLVFGAPDAAGVLLRLLRERVGDMPRHEECLTFNGRPSLTPSDDGDWLKRSDVLAALDPSAHNAARLKGGE